MLALRDVRYRALRAVIFALVRRAVDREAAAKANGVAGGTEGIAAAIDIRNDGIKLRRCHLARGKAVEYELIQLILICGKIFLYLIRLERGIRGSDSFVRVLCARLGLIGAGGCGHIFLAVGTLDVLGSPCARLIRYAQRVGTHVGDKAHAALALDVHALVELLGDLHRLGRGEAELAAGLLLQIGGRERRGGMLALFAALHAADDKAALFHARLGFIRLLCVGEDHALAVQRDQPRMELFAARAQLRVHIPVFLRLKLLDLVLAVNHHARGDGLHAPRGQPLLTQSSGLIL